MMPSITLRPLARGEERRERVDDVDRAEVGGKLDEKEGGGVYGRAGGRMRLMCFARYCRCEILLPPPSSPLLLLLLPLRPLPPRRPWQEHERTAGILYMN